MIRHLSPEVSMSKTIEELIAICVLEGVPFERIASEALQQASYGARRVLNSLDVSIQRELAIATLEGIWREHLREIEAGTDGQKGSVT